MAQPKWAFYMTWGGMMGLGVAAARQPKRRQPHPLPFRTMPLRSSSARSFNNFETAGRWTRRAGSDCLSCAGRRQSEMLRRIIQRLQPGADALKSIYDDPYYIKRGDPIPK